MSENDWTTFTKRITIKADAEAIYRAWATQEGIESWFLRLSEFSKPEGALRGGDEFAQKGDKYRWLWHGWGDEVEQKGEILDCNGRYFFKFTFHDPMTVSVSIKSEEGETICELKQENIETDDKSKATYFMGCSEGWTFYLANLKSILEGGLDLRNRNVNIKSVVNS